LNGINCNMPMSYFTCMTKLCSYNLWIAPFAFIGIHACEFKNIFKQVVMNEFMNQAKRLSKRGGVTYFKRDLKYVNKGGLGWLQFKKWEKRKEKKCGHRWEANLWKDKSLT